MSDRHPESWEGPSGSGSGSAEDSGFGRPTYDSGHGTPAQGTPTAYDPSGYGTPAQGTPAQGTPTPYGPPGYGQPGYGPPGYGQPAYGPPGYPPPGYGYPPAPTNTMAILALVFAFVFAPVAIVLGVLARKEIARTGEQGHGLATAGMWLGIAFTALFVLAFLVPLLFILIAGVAAAGSSGGSF